MEYCLVRNDKVPVKSTNLLNIEYVYSWNPKLFTSWIMIGQLSTVSYFYFSRIVSDWQLLFFPSSSKETTPDFESY